MSSVTAVPEVLRTSVMQADEAIGVDVAARVIRGYVVAEAGDFKDKRGSFDDAALSRIAELGQAAGERGLRSRLSHPNESDDGLTKHLGRAKNFRRDGDKVRADLHIAEVAMDQPVGGGKPIGQYALDLASEDPGALGSSLVLKSEKLERKGPDGACLPPLWMPTELRASDLVADGDAVHGDLLSGNFSTVEALDAFMEGSERRLPTKLAVAGAQYLDQLFPNAERDVVQSRLQRFCERYLSLRFGDAEPEIETKRGEESEMDQEIQTALEERDARIDALAESIEQLTDSIAADLDRRKADASERQRAAEISALCKQAGYPDAEQLIADEQLGIEEARQKVFAWMVERNKSLNIGGDGLGDRPGPIDELRNQWPERERHLRQAGYTDRETWVRHQCAEQGIQYEPVAA